MEPQNLAFSVEFLLRLLRPFQQLVRRLGPVPPQHFLQLSQLLLQLQRPALREAQAGGKLLDTGLLSGKNVRSKKEVFQ